MRQCFAVLLMVVGFTVTRASDAEQRRLLIDWPQWGGAISGLSGARIGRAGLVGQRACPSLGAELGTGRPEAPFAEPAK